MITNYDLIAKQYKQCKQQPWRTHIETYTLMSLIDQPIDGPVIDLACGEGFYSRLIRARGAKRVTGLDISEGMIELARRQEEKDRLGIEYIVGDARGLQLGGDYDLAVAAYLLSHARNTDELFAMCDGITRCLRPGGRFVAVNSSPALDFLAAPSYRKYGFETAVHGSKLREGTPIRLTFFLENGPFEIEDYFIDVPTHEQVFRSAGFREIRWHAPQLSLEGETIFGREFWATFLEHPPISFVECLK